jgi:PAS domain S-box-containing protein
VAAEDFMKRYWITRKYNLAFSLALLMMGGIAALSYGSLLRIKQANQAVVRTYTVTETVNTVLSTLKDAEISQRGYLLTGKSSYLEPYNKAISTLNPVLDELAEQAATNPAQQKNVQQLRRLALEKLAELQKTIQLHQAQRLSAASAIVATDEGKQSRIMDQIQVLHKVMDQEELHQLALQSQQQQNSSHWTARLIVGGTILEAIVVGLIVLAINLKSRKLKQSQAILENLNAVLESRVQNRTTELSQLNQKLINEIQERQKVEIALQNRVAEVYDLYNNAPCGYQSLDEHGNYVQINDTALQWLGYSREEIAQKNFTDVLTPTGIAIFQRNFQLLKSGHCQQGNAEFEIVCKDGTILPINVNSIALRDATGKFISTRCTLNDVRDRKRAENILREAERRWRSLLENVRLVVVGLDVQGRVEFANPFFLELTGYTYAEVIGQPWFTTFLPLHQRPKAEAAFHEILEQEFYPYYQNPIVTKSGQERLIAWNNTLLRDLEGNVLGTLSIGEDITQRIAVEHLKNEFISIVSHELRTPLTSIRGSLGLIASGALQAHPAQLQRMIEIAAIDTERLVRLVNDILDLEHLESGKLVLEKAIYDMTTLIQQSLEVMQSSADAAQVTLVAEASAIQLWVDGDRIIQTLTNLLSNAIKFSPPGSTVKLSVKPLENLLDDNAIQCFVPAQSMNVTQQENWVAAIHRNASVLFQVTDHGRGIPDEKLDTIFGKFQQVDASDSRSKGGTGLGLAICRNIIEQHGGCIWAESIWGEGSTFSFTLSAEIPQHSVWQGGETITEPQPALSPYARTSNC